MICIISSSQDTGCCSGDLPLRSSVQAALDDGFVYALVFSGDVLTLQNLLQPKSAPLRVDFCSGQMAYRLKFGRNRRSLLARAVGIKPGKSPFVIDATAGLGQDSFVLASLGCRVVMFERSPVIGMLLADGLRRAALDAGAAAVVSRMALQSGDARLGLAGLTPQQLPDVIYLDPMFPESKSSALNKKEMRICRDVVGDDADAHALLESALQLECARVAVKRMRSAPPLGGRPASQSLLGKTNRFDLYLKQVVKA